MGECKTKAIQANLGTFRQNQTYPGIIQAYPGIFRTLCYPDIFKLWYIQNPNIFRTPAYSEPWYIWRPPYIHNAGIFKIWGIFRYLPRIYDEALINVAAIIIFPNYSYSCFARWSKYFEVVFPEVVMPSKNLWRTREPGSWIFDILIDTFK